MALKKASFSSLGTVSEVQIKLKSQNRESLLGHIKYISYNYLTIKTKEWLDYFQSLNENIIWSFCESSLDP